MTVLAEAMAAQGGLVKDPSGNLVYPEQLAVEAPAPVAPAPVAAPAPTRAAAPAREPTPTKPTALTADIPEPPLVGQSSPLDRTPVKKKTLLGA
jgi:hypothetical protein